MDCFRGAGLHPEWSGQESSAAGPNAQVAVDAFSYSLHYFNGDYLSIGTQSANFIATQAAGSNLGQLKKDLYNGNIGAMVTTITHPTTRAILPLGNVHEYDQLNRLATARSFDNLDLNTNTWGSAGAEKYYNAFTYDANGNILRQLRKDQNNNTIDSLSYKYHKNSSGKTVRNRLYSVNETISSSAYTDDIDSMSAFIPDGNINIDNNYSYDAEGRLIKDVQEGITNIVWRVDSKVKTIYKLGASTPKIISFDYDAMGHRIAKHVYNGSGTLERSTYYTLDAQGNAMVVYEREVNASNQTITFTVEEKMIYGSTRLGVLNDSLPMLGTQNNTYSQKLWSHVVGKRTYELANHLGNVLSVISDKVIPHNNGGNVDYYMADIRQAQDYSPFGVTLYGRNFSASGADGFRYGFQGQEMDDEIKGKGNSVNYTFRMHDPRLGRFFAIDPLVMKYPYNSPYSFSENRVVDCAELEGKEKWDAIVFLNPDGVINKIVYQLHVGPPRDGMKKGVGIYWEVRQGTKITPDPENTSSTFNQSSRAGNHYYQGMFTASLVIGRGGTYSSGGKSIDVKSGGLISPEQAIEFGVPVIIDGVVKQIFEHVTKYTPVTYYWYFDNAVSDKFSSNKAGKDYSGVVRDLAEININNHYCPIKLFKKSGTSIKDFPLSCNFVLRTKIT